MKSVETASRQAKKVGLKVSALVLLGLSSWTHTALAATGCLLDNEGKVCLSLNPTPSSTVQPSGLAGQPTFVRYMLTLSNAITNSSSRNLFLDLSLSPNTGFVSVENPNTAACVINAASLRCDIDKLDDATPINIVAIANAPPDLGDETAPSLTATAEFGNGGNTKTIYSTVVVSENSGASYIPANTAASLVTSPETEDPSLQVNAGSPLWGKAELLPQPAGYFAQISLITAGPSRACVGGLFLTSTDGGPYLCKDQGFPYDSGNANRWVMLDTTTADFTIDVPMTVTVVHDPSIISKLQLQPSGLGATGTPPYAVFHSALPIDGHSKYDIKPIGNTCAAAPVPPCLTAVTRYGNGVWRATVLKVNDGKDVIENEAARSSLAPLMALMDYVINVSGAGIIKPPSLLN